MPVPSSIAIEATLAILALYIAGALVVAGIFAYHFSQRPGRSLTEYETLKTSATAGTVWPALLYALLVDFIAQY